MFDQILHLLPYFMCANSEGSEPRNLAWAFTGRLFDKYHNLMSWLILSSVYFYSSQYSEWETLSMRSVATDCASDTCLKFSMFFLFKNIKQNNVAIFVRFCFLLIYFSFNLEQCVMLIKMFSVEFKESVFSYCSYMTLYHVIHLLASPVYIPHQIKVVYI